MPIYEYECKACGHAFEYLLLHNSPAAKCPSCGKKNLQKMISKCAVSSEGTRQLNFDKAKKAASVVHKDKAHEDHKEYHRHMDEGH
jgi:putative FmdB family regulatory protein